MSILNPLKSHIMLAPMEGVVDPWIREILTSFGHIDFCVTEFMRVTSQKIPDATFYEYAPELKTNSRTLSGTPVFLQLLGSDLNFMALNAFRAVELGAFGIDINFGCPAKTVNRHDGGSVILKNPERVYQITKAVRAAVPRHIPVNAKVRLGFEHKDFHKDIACAAEDGGAGWLVVHARTKIDGYKPPAYWEFIKSMKAAVRNMPIIANGEIWTPDDYNRCREISDCKDVMMGRGFMAEPLLAYQIKSKIAPSDQIPPPSQTHTFMNNFQSLFSGEHNTDLILFYIHHFILKYIEICPNKETRFLIGRTKQLIKLLSRNHREFSVLFEKIKTLRTLNEIQNMILEYTKSYILTPSSMTPQL